MGDVSAPIVTTFIVYLIGMVGIGVWVYRRTDDLNDFALGGRSLGSGTAALSAQASDMSGWLLLGLPGAVYASGVGAAWIGVGLLIGTYLNWRFTAARLRAYTERAGDSITLSSYFEERFERRRRALRLASALIIIVFFSVYVASGLVAGGLLFEQVLGVDQTLAITLSVVVIVSYTILGGFLAVSYTDAIQGSLMLLALLVLPVVAVIADGGFASMTTELRNEAPGLLGLTDAVSYDGAWTTTGSLSFLAIASSLSWGFGYFGQPHILARFMGIRSVRAVPAARRIGTSWVALTLTGAALAGLAGIVYFEQPLDNQETVFLNLVDTLLNPWVGGFLLAAVLAAIMSTADSQLLVVSTAITEDVYRPLLGRDASERALLWIGRGATVAVALIAYLLALQGGTVLGIVAYAWAGFGATFGPMILLSLYWPRMTGEGALAGMVVGAVTVIAWEQAGLQASTDVYSMIPGVLLSTAAVIGASLLTTPPQEDWSFVDESEEELIEEREAAAAGRA